MICDKCGKPMVFKQSRYGRFIGCSGYPECKNIKKITSAFRAPQEGCGGELVENSARSGAGSYFGCSNYPGRAASSSGSAPSRPRARSAARRS